MPDVVVVGAGPVGILLAAELARRAVDVAVIERRADAAQGSRAIGVHPPVLAALETSGATARLLADARRVSRGEARSAGALLGVVRFDRLSRRFPFVATLPQPATHRALSEGAPPPIRAEATAVRRAPQPAVVLADGREITGRLVVVAGGPRARRLLYRSEALRIRPYPDRFVMADVAIEGPEDAVVHLDGEGVLESFPLPGGRRRFVAPGPDGVEDPAGRAAVLRAALRARGQDDAAELITAAEGFSIRHTVVPRMRRGPVLAVGDTAHEVSPMGGQGMNLGLLDAVTLAPVLAAWVRAGDPPEAELRRWERRRRASARTSGAIATLNTMLGRPAPPRVDVLRRAAMRAALATPAATLLAHAYAMGFDRDS